MKNSSHETNANRLSTQSCNHAANLELNSKSQNWINIANEALAKINQGISSVPQESELNALLLDSRELLESWIRLINRNSPLALEITQLLQSSCELLELEYRTNSKARANPNFTAILNSTRAWLAELENNPLNQLDLDLNAEEGLLREMLGNRENQKLTRGLRRLNPLNALLSNKALKNSPRLLLREHQHREEELKERLLRQDELGLRHLREDENLEHQLREEALRERLLRQEELLERLEREELLRAQILREEVRQEREIREQERLERELREDERRERNRREELRKERNLREQEQRELGLKELLQQERALRNTERLERLRAEGARLERNRREEERRERNRREEELRELNRGELLRLGLNRRQEDLLLESQGKSSLPLLQEQLNSPLTSQFERNLLDEILENGPRLQRALNEDELENADLV